MSLKYSQDKKGFWVGVKAHINWIIDAAFVALVASLILFYFWTLRYERFGVNGKKYLYDYTVSFYTRRGFFSY
ncbi:MAG: hypothetical protein H8E34_11110 [Bacteroidetes bacterium]|nr:hypothetical protein [Bacteroidota bacterium]